MRWLSWWLSDDGNGEISCGEVPAHPCIWKYKEMIGEGRHNSESETPDGQDHETGESPVLLAEDRHAEAREDVNDERAYPFR
jgi:hypothetical protein